MAARSSTIVRSSSGFVFPRGTELLNQEYTGADQTGITSTSGVDVTGLTGATPVVGNRPVMIFAHVARMRLNAGTPPLFGGIALLEGSTVIDTAYVQSSIAVGSNSIVTPPVLMARRSPPAGTATVYKVQLFVQSGATWWAQHPSASYIRVIEV